MLYLLSLALSVTGCGAFSLSETPIDTIVVKGQDAQLNCSFDDWTDETLSWHKETPYPFQISIGPEVAPGYELIYEYEAGKYSIGIPNTTVDKDGIHRCEAFLHPTLRASAELFVIEDWVNCTVHPGFVVKEYEEVVFKCSADRGAPPGDLLWQMDGKVTSKEQGLSKNEWIYSFNKSENGAVIDCFMRHVTLPPPLPSCQEEIVIDVQYAPTVVIRNGSEGVVVEGRTYEAVCDVDANPTATVFWKHPSGDTTAGEILLLDDVTRDQHGEYKCFANNTFWDNSTASSEESHSLDVQFPPSVGVPPEVPCKLGESVQLTCHKIDANPSDVDYTWYLANGDIFSNATVEITNITRDLHGEQFCTANNTYHEGTYGTGSNVTLLDVQYPPVVNNSRIDTKERDAVVLRCRFDSNPYPSEFQWTNDDVLLSNESAHTINDVTRDDAGNYTCTVTTVFYDLTNASDQGIVHLRVEYLASVNITILPSSISEGDDVDIYCKASDGDPEPNRIELIFKDEHLATNDSQELHHKITDIKPGSSGSYSCRAFTLFYDGSEEYSVSNKDLVVYYSARLLPSDEKELQAEIGEDVDINCTAHGMPVPSIKWFDTNDRKISDEDYNFEIRNHQPIGNVVTSILSVTLADSTYYGEYVCEATNADDVTGDRQSTTIIELVTEDGSDSLIAIITVSVLVLIILIVIIVAIIVCLKRRSKEQNGQSLDNLTYWSPGEEQENVEFQRREPDGTSSGDDINPYAETGTLSSFQPQTSNSEKSAQKTEGDNTDGSSAASVQQDNKNADNDENIDSLYAKPHKTKDTGNTQEVEAVPQDSESSANALVEAPNRSQTFETDVPGSISRGDDTSGAQSKQDIERPEITYTDLDFPDTDGQIESQQQLPSKDHTDYTTIRYM